jgi:toxin YhaV
MTSRRGPRTGRGAAAALPAGSAAPRDGRPPLVVHGWTLFPHPLLLDQLERLRDATLDERRRSRMGPPGPNEKLLAHLFDLILDKIPQNPGSKAFRQDDSLGEGHWFRGKTGNGRYRLFFRFDSRAKIIIYAWVNNAETLRTFGATTDAYAVFAGMLDRGNPPDDWPSLLAAAQAVASRRWHGLAALEPRHHGRAD